MTSIDGLRATDGTTNILVLGAGVVGFGVCDAWLKTSDTTLVVVVDASKEQLDKLAENLDMGANKTAVNRLQRIIGNVSSDPKSIQEAVKETLVGHPLHHVVTALGCPIPNVSLLDDPDAVAKTKATYDDVFFPNLTAAHTFLPMVQNVSGSTFTVAGGPFTHHCPDRQLLAVSLMGATLNHFGTILNALTRDTPCRGNTICCHYAIGYPFDSSSSFGPLLDKDFGPVTDVREWGKAFVRVAQGTERLGFICMHDAEETAVLVASEEWIWYPEKHKYGPKPSLDSSKK